MTLKEEALALKSWYFESVNRINKMPSSGGLDGQKSSEISNLNKELKRKMKVLEEKYNASIKDIGV